MKGIEGLVDGLLAKGLAMAHYGRSTTREHHLPAGFLLGNQKSEIPGEDCEPVILLSNERRKHVYVIGATGCGKTNLLLRLIEDEISQNRTCVVIDLRGDLIDRILIRLTANEPDAIGRVHLIDLREDEFVTPFNPLSGSGDIYSRAFHLLEVVKHNAESWGIQLEETLRNSLIALAEGGRSLLDIERLLEDNSFREQVLAICADDYVQAFFERYGGLSSDKQLAWSLPVLNKITPLLSIPQIRKMIGARRGFDWRELLDTRSKIVLVALAAHRFHGAAHLLGGLLVSSLQGAIMARASIPEVKRNPVTLFIDEFETMASGTFGTIIAEGRRFGLSLVLSHQNLSQLGSELRQVIRGNVHVQLFFQTGSSDASDLASDISLQDSKDNIRQALISQAVGEAFVVRRGLPSIQVVTPISPDPPVESSTVLAFKLNALEAHCLPVSECESNQKRSSTKSSIHPTPEVRHEKLPKTRNTL